MDKPIAQQQAWLTIKQAANYLGVSYRSMRYAIQLKKEEKANVAFRLKKFGRRTLVNRNSLDTINEIIIRL